MISPGGDENKKYLKPPTSFVGGFSETTKTLSEGESIHFFSECAIEICMWVNYTYVLIYIVIKS